MRRATAVFGSAFGFGGGGGSDGGGGDGESALSATLV